MEDTNKQILDKLSNLENYICAFVNSKEQQLINKINGLIGMQEYYEKHSKKLEQRNNELFEEVCRLSKEVVRLNQEIVLLKQKETNNGN